MPLVYAARRMCGRQFIGVPSYRAKHWCGVQGILWLGYPWNGGLRWNVLGNVKLKDPGSSIDADPIGSDAEVLENLLHSRSGIRIATNVR